ncbi:hypothetical protein A4X09_0g1383 [Tilletia walkeri]|uniref:Uncharacterized protein n=1 Tax=Tilletia walkeri TaxID=117179 RepID=A0A8X7NCV8_9BASI|nr:hypothetical protein A4X09_0g1383 [Tilletia walkeri]
MSRQEGVDMVAAAGQYDAVRSDPDQAEIDFDQAEYFRRRREIAANRTADQTLKTVVSPPLIQVVINRLLSESYGAAVYDCSCLACGLRFLGDTNTGHRCHPAAEEIPVRILKTEADGGPNSDNYTDRDMLFLLSDVAERFGLESILTTGSEGNQLRYVDVGIVLEPSMIWDALVPYIQQRYPAQLAEFDTSYLTEPRPFLITDTAAQVPNSVEYDALFWAVTKLFTLIHGARDSTNQRLSHSNITTLLKIMQKDVRDAVAHVSCGVAPPKEPCLYSNITSIKNQDGTQRRVQHRHRGKSNADHVGAHLTTIFDLPTDYVRRLVLSEGMGKSYDKDSQSCLLWGLSHKIEAFRDIRPLADQDHQDKPSLPQASSSTSAPTAAPMKRTRVNFDHVDFDTVARSLSDEGALCLVVSSANVLLSIDHS